MKLNQLCSDCQHNSKWAYVSERRVGEEGEAFEQVLVVVVLNHRRPVGLKQDTNTVR